MSTVNSQLCQNQSSFLYTSDFTAYSFHVLTFFEIPIHFMAAYVIIKKTPTKMSNVKWVMFNLHFWSALLDLSLSLLVTPYIFFPVAAGYSFGILRWFGVHSGAQLMLIVIEIGATIVSNIALFENRYSIIATSSVFSKNVRKLFIYFAYIFATVYFIPFLFMVPDQSAVLSIVHQKLPTIRCFYSGPIYVFTMSHTLVATVTAFKVLIEFSCIVVIVVCTFMSLLDQLKNTKKSRNTLAIQKKFFIGIIVQTSIPVFIFMIPLGCFFITMMFGIYSQALNNICFLIISCHGLFSTIGMILIHRPYRLAMFPYLRRRYKRNRVSSISSVW